MIKNEPLQLKDNLPPLVVGVDVPDAALDEDLVLVHGQQGAQSEGGDLLHHDGVAGTVALEHLETKWEITWLDD